MKKFIACALAGAVLLTSPAPLAAESAKDLHVPKGAHVLLCKFAVTARDKTTPPMALVMTDPSGKMLAYDGLMAYGHLPPQPVAVLTENNIRTTYGWTVPGGKDDLNQYAPSIKVRLTVQKADMSALLMVNPVGYRTESARGSCQAGVVDK